MAVIVILGAGASFDCVSQDGVKNESYTPPLTYELFSSKPSFDPIQSKYNYVSNAAAEIKANTTKGSSSSIENYIRNTFYNSSILKDRKTYFQIPLYLQELFHTVGRMYTRRPENYQALVSQLTRLDEKVCFVTLNYDLLIDMVLNMNNPNNQLINMDSYTHIDSEKNWCLYKLHGSVNWSFRVNNVPNGASINDNFIGAFNRLSIENVDIGAYNLRDIKANNVSKLRFDSDTGTLYYPAIAVPIGRKDELICPAEHKEHLSKILEEERIHILIIGYSGNDEEVLSLLSKIDRRRLLSVKIVNRTEKTAGRVLEKLRDKIGFQPNTNHIEAGGFDRFIRGGSFRKYTSLTLSKYEK